jgi:hypothetical protein
MLQFLRKQWRKLDNSKAGQLKRFLSTSTATGVRRAGGKRELWPSELTDKQTATAYGTWFLDRYKRKGTVSEGDVTQARKSVIKKLEQGESLAKKVYDKNGHLQSKSKV